jgi:Na+/H+-translocating membrane pyrophosphatase
MWALEKGMYTAGVLFVAAAAALCGAIGKQWDNFACIVIGLVAGALIGKVTEYCKFASATGPCLVLV